MRHLGYPAGITLPQETRAGRLPYWQTLDASEHRQCAGWSRDSSASAGVGNEYRRARSVDQEGPLSVSQRARYGLAGCNARSGPQLSPFPRQVSGPSLNRERLVLVGSMKPRGLPEHARITAAWSIGSNAREAVTVHSASAAFRLPFIFGFRVSRGLPLHV
jgi:hypothetical protein